MPVPVECDQCYRLHRVSSQHIGKKMRCLSCGHPMKIVAPAGSTSTHDEIELSDADFEDDLPAPPLRPQKKSSSKKSSTSLRGRMKAVLLAIGVCLVLFAKAAKVARPFLRGFAGQNNQQQKQNPPHQTANMLASLYAELPDNPLARYPLANIHVFLPEWNDQSFSRHSDRAFQAYQLSVPLHTGRGGSLGQVMEMKVYLPPGEHAPRSLPCVLVPPAGTPLIHGSRIDSEMRNPEHLGYVRAGYAVITFSLDGWVDPQHSTDQLVSTAYQQFATAFAGLVNTEIAFQFARTRLSVVNPRQIFIAGHSSAGTLALLYAAHQPGLAGCLAYAPQTDVEQHVQHMLNGLKSGNVENVLPQVQDFARRSSPLNHVSQISCPVYLFQAIGDPVVTATSTRHFYDLLKATQPEAQYLESPGSDHYETMVTEGIPQGVKWLKERSEAIAKTPAPATPNATVARAIPTLSPMAAPLPAQPSLPQAPQMPIPDAPQSGGLSVQPAATREPSGCKPVTADSKLSAGDRVLALHGLNWEGAEVVEMIGPDAVKVHFYKLPANFQIKVSLASVRIPLPHDEIEPNLIETMRFEIKGVFNGGAGNLKGAIDPKLVETHLLGLEGYLPGTLEIDQDASELRIKIVRDSQAKRNARFALIRSKIILGRERP